MAVYYLTGRLFNLIGRALSGNLTSSSADGLFPLTNLADGRANAPFRFSAPAANDYISIDLNQVRNGNMETANAGNVANWTEANTGTGDVTRTTAAGEFNPSTGSTAGMKLVSGTGTAVAYQDVTVRAGERWNFLFSGKGDGGTGVAKFRVQNRQTGKYLTSGGAWQTASADVFTQTAAAWATMVQLTVAIESAAVCLADEVTLRIYVVNDVATKTVFADDVYAWPSVDFVSLHGHNIEPSITPELHSSTDGFGASDTTEKTLTTAQPAFWGRLAAPVDRRYWRVKFVGTNTAAIYVGELVLGQSKSQQRTQRYGWKLGYIEAQTRNLGPSGSRFVTALGTRAYRVAELPYEYHNSAELAEAVDEIFNTYRGGLYPIVLVPNDARAEVIFGRADETFDFSTEFLALWQGATLRISEDPFPSPLTGDASAAQEYSDMNLNRLLLEDGSVTLPACTFRQDDDSGLYRYSSNNVAITTGGVLAARFTDLQRTLVSGGSAANPGLAMLTDEDTGLQWISANVLGIIANAVEQVRFDSAGFAKFAAAIGIGGVTPASGLNLDVSGATAFRRAVVTVANGQNDNINAAGGTCVHLTGPTGAFSITGFQTVPNGRFLVVFNGQAQQMTIKNQTGSTAGQQIRTLTGADVVLRAGFSAAVFWYEIGYTEWMLIAYN